MTIVEFLKARLDERAQPARFAIELTERAYPADEFRVGYKWARLTEHKTSGGGGQSFELGAPTPEEVLADIAAKRAIIQRYENACRHADDPDEVEPTRGEWGVIASTYEQALCELAAPHADHEDYQREWKP